MAKKKRMAVVDVPLKLFTQLVEEVSRLRKDFDAHVRDEKPQWEEAVAGVGRIEAMLNNMEINGSGKKYSLPEWAQYIGELLKPLRRQREFRHKWEKRAVQTAEWCVKTRLRRRLAFFVGLFLALYLGTSVLEDTGVIHQNALKLAWDLATHWGQ